MSRFISVIFFVALISTCNAQNLVKNHDFEELVFGPYFMGKDWKIFGTVDVFAPYDAFYKQNDAQAPFTKEDRDKHLLEHYVHIDKTVKPQSGENFIGLCLSCFPTTKFSPDIGMEHIQGTLSQALTVGKKYKVSFWYRFAHEVSNAYGMNLGVYFSRNSEFVKCPGYRPIVPNSVYPQINYINCFNDGYKAQVSTPENEFIKDTVWTKFEGTFEAKGGEQFFTIGFFWQDKPEVVNALNKLKQKQSKSNNRNFVKATQKYLALESPYQVTGYPPKKYFPKGMKYTYILIDNVSVTPYENKE